MRDRSATYGSREWHRQQGEAIKNHEMEIAAAETQYEMDKKAVENLEEGQSAYVETDEGKVSGFILEIEDTYVTIENWNKTITVDARRVKQHD